MSVTLPLENPNYLTPHAFVFLIDKLPGAEYTMRSIELPALTLNPAERDYALVQTFEPGDKLQYAEFNLTFLIDENMENYIELVTWMQRLSTLGKKHLNVTPFPTQREKKSDASLIILNSNYNPIKTIQFYSIFPTNISTISFTIDNDTNIEYIEATATFQYTYFEFT